MQATPHKPTSAIDERPTRRRWDGLNRALVIGLHLILIVGFVMLLVRSSPQPVLDLESQYRQLASLDQFRLYMIKYGFLAVGWVLIVDLFAYFVLRRLVQRPVRWKWLLVSSLLIPLASYLSFLVFSPVVMP